VSTRTFGATWWGKAWVDALEHRAGVDPNRLARGRTYARQDRVVRLDLEAGQILASVRGSRRLPYRVGVGVRTLTADEWALLTAVIAGKAVHAAALLDGALDPGVLADADGVGVDLLPTPGDLRPHCSCPDDGHPCKHAAAVCYLVADALDEDPFVLFELRGKPRAELMAEVRAHRQAAALAAEGGPRKAADGGAETGTHAGVDPGLLARDAWAREPTPPPRRPELPRQPGEPSSWPADPPDGAPFTAEGLRALAVDAARRAWAQLANGEPSHLLLDREADLARRAAALLDRREPIDALVERSSMGPGELRRRATAWQHAGPEGVAALDESSWMPPRELIEAGVRAFRAIGVYRADLRIRGNRLTFDYLQLRVSPDGRWWRYEQDGRTWLLAEPPADTPDDLLSQ
jgi:uncharacterized Zn finger protein